MRSWQGRRGDEGIFGGSGLQPPLGRRDVVGCFDGGRITSDSGGLLLREVDQRIGLLNRMAACFTDYHNPNSFERSVQSLCDAGDSYSNRSRG